MDNAVALVQAYLRVNGYFTVAEYPVLEASGASHRMVTDIDILAFRFPRSTQTIPGAATGIVAADTHAPDPRLGRASEEADMLVGEVKEGHAEFNPSARDPAVLEAALVRFGCCSREEAPRLIAMLSQTGEATSAAGHRIRLVAFGSTGHSGPAPAHTVIPLGHVLRYLEDHLQRHWNVVRHSQTKDPALGFLMTLEKARRGVRD